MDTIPAAVAGAARAFGDIPALADPAFGRWSFAELHDQVRIVARAWIGVGLRPGDRLAIWAPNTAHWVLAALGASCAGITLVPVNTRCTAVEALDIIDRSGARGLVVSGPFLGVDRLGAVRQAGGPLPHVIVRLPADSAAEDGVLEWADLMGQAGHELAVAVQPGDVSDILFTSGTTGRSKGAMSAHRQALAVATDWARIAGLRAGDRYLVINPFFHSFGLKAGILACLVSGATIVPQPVFDAAAAMKLIAAERITVLPGPPTLYTSLLDHPDRAAHDLSTLRLAVTGAADVPPALIERMWRELGFETVLTAYGLTEAVVATMCRPGDDAETIAHTCGRAAAGFQVRIAEPGGEVLLRGPNVMLGYLDDPQATAAAIDPAGWLHTGDAGRLDERGYLTITDRLKDMYICGGFNVYPAEVERALAALPAVAESAVVGVPDARLGEVGKAFVVPRPGCTVTSPEVIEFCRGRLANYKVPRAVEVRDSLPRNASGKVLKYLLRKEA